MAEETHPAMISPDDQNIRIWHYMDFTKFVSMLEYSGLFFRRVDLLDDPFEGSYSRANEQLRPLIYKDMPEAELQAHREVRKDLRQWTMVNCWHMNENESVAMWKIYARPNQGIAIQSKYAVLRECLGEEVLIGMVHYKNYKTDFTPEENVFYPFMQKRTPFEYERELRAIIQDLPGVSFTAKGLDIDQAPPHTGTWKSINLAKLIENIYVYTTDPHSLQWFRELVWKVAQRYGLDKRVIPSSLVDSEPFF